MERPQNKDDLRRFLGMVTYLAKFIPQLSAQSAPLRSLLEQKNEWMWSHEQETCWKTLKEILIAEPVLKFYDPERRIRISADASQYGVGAVLLQQYDDVWQPVAYASRALSATETRYAQIEKELLAITYACERFHQFVYGQAFTVETDHKPLVPIMAKSLNDCPLRIQRMLIRLQKYDANLIYTPGKYMFAADTLSRAVDRQEETETCATEIKAYVDMVVASLPVSADRTDQIKQETEKDETMKELKVAIQEGWPEEKKDCPVRIRDYWACRSELTVEDGIIFKGCKFVIPASLRKEMLKKIHEGHLGEEKCKRRAREVMYWPRINLDTSQLTAACELCLTFRPRQQAEPLLPHLVTSRPYYKVGADLFDCDGKSHIVVTDYYSNYPEVATLQSTASKAVIAFMKSTFARHGVPCVVFTDNGPQFSSSEFKKFSEEWGFRHDTSSPNYPRSNGLAENAVKIVKGLMRKAHAGNEDFHRSLMIYRSAPLENGLSPAQMLMGRRIRTNLPIREDLLDTPHTSLVKTFKLKQKIKQKRLYDRKAKPLTALKPGDTVKIRNHNTGMWSQQGKVEKQVAPRSYEILTDGGTTLRRNRIDLCPKQSSETEMQDPTTTAVTSESMVTENAQVAETVPETMKEQRPKRNVKPPERLIEVM